MTDDLARVLHHMNTAWHPLFILLIEHLVSRDWYRVISELQLTREPLRLDALIVRKEREGAAPPPTHLHSVLDDLRDHNVVHFKGPSDELERADALQLLAYCAQSMILEGVYEPARVSIRVVAPTLTRRFTEQVEQMHGELRPTALKGVHDGRLGCFALRVVETSVVWPQEHEHLLYAVSPAYVAHPEAIPALDDKEQFLFYLLCQSVARFRREPTWKTIMKDAGTVEKAYTKALHDLLQMLPPEERFAGITPAQRLEGLTPAQRLEGLAPAQRLEGLSVDQQLLALPEATLQALSDEYIATLPADTQAAVRARRGR